MGPPAAGASSWRESLEESLPLLSFGAVCVVIAFVSLSSGTHVGPSRFPLWELFVAIGSISLAGGSASVFAGPDLDEETLAPPRVAAPVAPRTRPVRSTIAVETLARPARAPYEPKRSPPAVAPQRPPTLSSTGLLAAGPAFGSGSGTPLSARRALRPQRSTGDTTRDRARAASRLRRDDSRNRLPTRSAADDVPRELDSLLASLAGAVPRGPRSTDRRGSLPECGGCGSAMTPDSEGEPCTGCARPLCRTCADLAELEGLAARCSECQAALAGRRRVDRRRSP